MRDFIIIFVALFLVSCADTYFYPKTTAKAEEVCKSNDGWEHIKLSLDGSHYFVYCKNGAKFGPYRKEK